VRSRESPKTGIAMNWLMSLFGQGSELTAVQMTFRALLVFFIALLLIRISGRRSFGMRTPLDNIIVILLGALLSRAIVGASPFGEVVAASFVIVLLHRLLGWAIAHNAAIGSIVEGDTISLFRNHEFLKKNMEKALVSTEDVMQGVRTAAATEDMSKINTVYMERNGEISVTKAQNQ
jgi:uncharacterized membrane protein YcaP (DUF421 family)